MDTTLTPEQAELLIEAANIRMFVAVSILTGMLLASVATLCFAFNLRRSGLVLMAVYGCMAIYLNIGFSLYFGAATILFAATGMVLDWVRAGKPSETVANPAA